MNLLKLYEDDGDLEQLQVLYKKYFAVNFIYINGRDSIGQRVYDIIYNFKHNGEDEFRKKAPVPSPLEPSPPEPSPSTTPSASPSLMEIQV